MADVVCVFIGVLPHMGAGGTMDRRQYRTAPLSKEIRIRLTPQEKQLLKETAKDHGISMSLLVRLLLKPTHGWHPSVSE
jgi:hypothetical protein